MIAQANLDPELPLGVFVFAPRTLDCLEWVVGTSIQRRIGSGDTTPAAGEPGPEGCGIAA